MEIIDLVLVVFAWFLGSPVEIPFDNRSKKVIDCIQHGEQSEDKDEKRPVVENVIPID